MTAIFYLYRELQVPEKRFLSNFTFLRHYVLSFKPAWERHRWTDGRTMRNVPVM